MSCRLHAQALTLAALAGAAVVEYFDHHSTSEPKVDKYANQFLAHSQKDWNHLRLLLSTYIELLVLTQSYMILSGGFFLFFIFPLFVNHEISRSCSPWVCRRKGSPPANYIMSGITICCCRGEKNLNLSNNLSNKLERVSWWMLFLCVFLSSCMVSSDLFWRSVATVWRKLKLKLVISIHFLCLLRCEWKNVCVSAS